MQREGNGQGMTDAGKIGTSIPGLVARVVVSIDQTAFFMQLNSIWPWVTHIPLFYSHLQCLSISFFPVYIIYYTSTCSMGSTKHAEKSSVTLLKKKFSYLYYLLTHHGVYQLHIYMLECFLICLFFVICLIILTKNLEKAIFFHSLAPFF